MVEASIASVVQSLEAETIVVRTQGLADLRRFLSQQLGAPKSDTLEDDGFHKILENLFRIVRSDKSAYLSGAPTTRKRAETRLNTTAAALRLVVEVSAPKIRHRTACAVLDHIIDTLPTKDEEFCKPLRNDYIKSFRLILEYAPHGEHLRARQWQSYVDFVLEGIASGHSSDSEEVTGSMNASMQSTMNRNMSLRISQSSSARNALTESYAYIDDFFACLRSLTSITNSPLSSRVVAISEALLTSLEQSNRSSEFAFESLNNVLLVALASNITLASEILSRACLLIRRLWSVRSPTLREQMIIALSLGEPLYQDLVKMDSSENNTQHQLMETLLSEYAKRPGDMLQISDLIFGHNCQTDALSSTGVHPNYANPAAIMNWTTLSVMASIVAALDDSTENAERNDIETGPRKRLRKDNQFSDLIRLTVTTSGSERLAAIQIMTLLPQRKLQILLQDIGYLERLLASCNDQKNSESSWVILLLAQIATHPEAARNGMQTAWQQAWKIASRSLTSTTTTRAASFLMSVLLQYNLINPGSPDSILVDAVFPSGTGGPLGLTDASLNLLTSCLSSRLLETEKSFEVFANRTLTWLDSYWIMPSTVDRGYNAQLATFGTPEHLRSLLIAVVGRRAVLRPLPCHFVTNAIQRTQMLYADMLPFTRFYAKNPETPNLSHNKEAFVESDRPVSESLFSRLSTAVIEFLMAKVNSFHEVYTSLAGERTSNMSLEIAENLATVCVVCCAIGDELGMGKDSSRWKLSVQKLWQDVCDFVSNTKYETSQQVTSRLAARVLRINNCIVTSGIWMSTVRKFLYSPLLNIMQHLEENQSARQDLDMDFTDSIPSLNSQSSQGRFQIHDRESTRRDLPPILNDHTLFEQTKLLLLLETFETYDSLTPETMSKFVDYIISLDSIDLMAVRTIIIDFMTAKAKLKRKNALTLLDRMAKVCLQEDEYERNEAALCFCLKILAILAPLWTSADDDDLNGTGFDIYSWFLDVALGKNIASSRVLHAMSSMLNSVLDCNPNYATDNLQSPRTSLLKILQVGDVTVKFHLVPTLARLFDGYVLTQHAALFDDIVDCLPTDPENHEGIAVRLYILASLGAQWHTILRQAVYHMFETAANVPLANSIAFRCMKLMCQKVNIAWPFELFKLFCPQILYTWLEKGTLDTIPFMAFGYRKLSDLLEDTRGELVAQISMRASAPQIKMTSEILGRDWSDLLEENFAQAEAYAIATDLTIHRSGRGMGKLESTISKQLTAPKFIKLTKEQLPQIVSNILLSVSDDRGFEKAFLNSQEDSSPCQSYDEMCRHSCSSVDLPTRQQPAFRAKHTIQLLLKACISADIDFESLWTPALLVFVCRSLLDDSKPALGPLHSAAVVRKLRMVVALAGPSALSGYPLEMLLHNIRPYLTQFHCAEDAFGIFWYLLDRGRDHLRSRVAFVTGLSVSIFISLSHFVVTSQDSTTQENQFLSTMSKAQEFRQWLASYLPELGSTDIGSYESKTFENIIRYAKDISKMGSNSKQSAEGNLLYHLLADHVAVHPLLSETFFGVAVSSLAHEFQISQDPSDEILSDINDTIRFAPALWSIVQRFDTAAPFRGWVATVLGRAYALQGPSLKLPSTRGMGVNTIFGSVSHNAEDSCRRVTHELIRILWSADIRAASDAERTLSCIFSTLPNHEKATILGQEFDRQLLDDLTMSGTMCPSPVPFDKLGPDLSVLSSPDPRENCSEWASRLSLAICSNTKSLAFVNALLPILASVTHFAREVLPYLVHLVLNSELEKQQLVREKLSILFAKMIHNNSPKLLDHLRLILRVILYLRSCSIPTESTMAKRNLWLAVDLNEAAAVALSCHLPHSALLFLEIHTSQHTQHANRTSKRSSVATTDYTGKFLASIYHDVDDPDFFYGKHDENDISSVLEKLHHEGFGNKNLAFQSALFDSSVKTEGIENALQEKGNDVVSALSLANFHGLSTAIKQYIGANDKNLHAHDYSEALMNTHQWDLWRGQQAEADGNMVQFMLQSLSRAPDKKLLRFGAESCLLKVLEGGLSDNMNQTRMTPLLRKLTILSEINEILCAASFEELDETFEDVLTRIRWDEQCSFDSVSEILTGREAIFAAIGRNDQIRSSLGLSKPHAMLFEIKAVRSSLKFGRAHEASQFCLNRAAHLSKLNSMAEMAGVNVKAAVQYDLANTLWAQNETTASIRVLHELQNLERTGAETIAISKAEILTDLGQKIAEARLERPDEITTNYLVPAIKALGKNLTGTQAGRVFHNFAAFCDEQLRDTVGLDDFSRIEKIRDRKMQEVLEFEAMLKKAEGKTKDSIKMHYGKAKTWFKLDDEEWKRLRSNRQQLIQQCLENYLLSLQASDDYPNDVLRFLALWLGHTDNPDANVIVERHLGSIPSLKFAPLMNQLTSRILDKKDQFQRILFELMFRICCEHPFHSLYQLFATSKSRSNRLDEIATSRHTAAGKLATLVQSKGSAKSTWISVHNSNIAFVRLAVERIPEKEAKTGSKILLRSLQPGQKLEQTIQDLHQKIPPPTLRISLRQDKDYSSVPTFDTFDPQMSIAGGVSAPKIITITASDGSRHKMLLKGGNDDLRQDAIMEQVFEQVSELLQHHRPTRQRRLGIRTYKVIPLTHNAGIIEFVKDTLPLHDYLLPAHTRYFPKDFKPQKCRREISDTQTKPLAQRLTAYRTVTANFHPVMRFFFMEKFLDPDDWFYKRLNYSRSTAAISMLGHVLGLGDRHGHNILLDEQTGEVVHIDLGVAFEAGRVLPVPEVVPFRLTRDLVDGMGISGVEGPFRRCCQFTLEALRRNQEAIMTILDVLRWDPLYSWSVSPLRIQRMQENQEAAAAAAASDGDGTASATPGSTSVSTTSGIAGATSVQKKDINEPSEADRALTVVAKKLSASLSVEATVNELIRQATDERNLAVLYCGWAAYA